MKKLTIVILLALMAIPFLGKGQESEMELMRKIFSLEKKAMVENFLQLSGSDANAFWDLYNAYEEERVALADKRIQLINDYADQYAAMTNDQASSLADRSFALRMDRIKLQKKYFKKISKAVDAKIATGFFQLEEYLQTAVNYDLYEAIPFVGE